MTVLIDRCEDINLKILERVAIKGEAVELGAKAKRDLATAHRAFKAYVKANPQVFIYGVTNDYGPNVSKKLDANTKRKRREQGAPFMGLSFGDGVWEDAKVRAMMFATLALFLRGGAAVVPQTAEAMAKAISGPLPRIPDGGLTSPGEMLPMFYLFEAVPDVRNKDMQASHGNTAASSVGMAGIAAIRARRRMELAIKIFVLSIEAIKAPLEHFDPALKKLWGDPYEGLGLDRLNHWLHGVPTKDRRPFQAPVSYRVLPRLLGQSLRASETLAQRSEEALQSMVSNPIFLREGGREVAISTGGYHNAPVAQALDSMAAAWVDLASLAHRHIIKLHRGAVSHLPDRLIAPGDSLEDGRSTTYLEFVPNDILDEMRRWAEPSLLSPGEAGASLQDDVSAPGMIAARNEARVAILFDRVLAVLAATALHALLVTDRAPPPRLKAFAKTLRKYFPPLTKKRVLGDDLARLSKALTQAVEQGSPLLPGQEGAP